MTDHGLYDWVNFGPFHTAKQTVAKVNDRGYKDYAELKHKELMTVCTCKGRVPQDGPVCERNREECKRGNGYCLYYRANGTYHCDKQLEKKE